MYRYLKSCGVEFGATTDWKDNPVSEFEIVIGDTERTSDQGNTQSSKTVGSDEYFVHASGNRVYIGGGSEDAVLTGVRTFLHDFFGYEGDNAPVPNVLNVGIGKSYDVKDKYYRMAAYFSGQQVFDRKFYILNKQFECVSIETGDSESEKFAGSELTKYLSIIGVSTGESDGKIILNVDKSLPEDGYKVQVKRNKVTITGGNERGVIYGAYGLLTRCAGMAFYTDSVESLGEGDVIVSESFDYTPVFESRMTDWGMARQSVDWCVKNGINTAHFHGISEEMGGKVSYGKYFVHNIRAVTGTPGDRQPCLTDPENLEKAIKFVRDRLQNEPGLKIVTVSQMDNNNYCKCANCASVDEEEGSHSGSLIRFINAIAADIADDYSDVIVDTLAYLYSRKPPKITKPLPNVCIRLCSIECCFSHSLDDPSCPENASFREDIEGWCEICNRLYIWDYGANFGSYIPTFPNFDVLRQNMRFFADHNVKGMFVQGVSSNSGEFGELKNYLIARLMLDPYMSKETYYDLMDGFLKAYYGDGWKYLRAYIDMIIAEAAGCQRTLVNPYLGTTLEKYGRYEDLFEEWWSKAEEMAGDRVENVRKSRLQWRYIKLSLHPDKAEAQKLISDVQRWGTDWGDAVGTAVPERANLELGPELWYVQSYWLP
ncbi:MAG: DUF4838 domain-containing protein [Clostridia bacterium]|nr:DUF4838 domain-containing protein [Clostridia bacterium]